MKKYKTFQLIILIVVLLSLLTLSLFKNISYPLMWGDEAETAVFAERILDYGYPKMHDSKNSMWTMISGQVGVWEKYDLYTANMWGQYYFATLSAYLARQVGDLFFKTALFRIPFALAGVIGVLALPFSVLFIFGKDRNKKLLFYAGYLFLQLFLVSLILHLREVRSYSLAVLFSSLVLIIFSQTYFNQTLSKWKYIVLMLIVCILLFGGFPPAYMAMVAALGSYVVIDFFVAKYKERLAFNTLIKQFFRRCFYLVLPLIISIFVAISILILFGISKTSSHAYADMVYGFTSYFDHLSRILRFLILHNFLILEIAQKVVQVVLFASLRKKTGIRNMNFALSNFLSYILLVYILLTPLTPYLFDRYFIFLQPLIALMIILDLLINLEAIRNIYTNSKRLNYIFDYLSLVIFVFVIFMVPKIDSIKGHLYEITHRYVGPVDEIIMYLNNHIKDPADLVIETNLEQTSFVYYLGSQVFCDEITICKKALPDIIIPRRYLLTQNFVDRMNSSLKSSQYDKVLLPILDYPTNNIPEFTLSLRHLFKTPLTDNDNEKVVLFIKK